MDPFEGPFWSQLQAVLWVYARDRRIVRLAADWKAVPRDLHDRQHDESGFSSDADLIAEVVMPHGIGRRLHPNCTFEEAEAKVLDALGRGSLRAKGRRNGNGDREQIPRDQSSDLQLYWDWPSYEACCRLPQAVMCSGRYAGPRDQQERNVTCSTDVILERDEVLALWRDPRLETLRAKTEPLKLAEAVALLVRGRPSSKKVWRRLRRRHGGRFPAAIEEEIELCGSTPCADAIWTEPELGDGEFNEDDRGYRYVVLKRQQFIDTTEAQGNLPPPEGASNTPKNDRPDRADEVAASSSPLQQQATRGFSRVMLETWYRDVWIKRKEEEGEIPTRDEDWQAARSEVSSNVPRDAVRRLRGEFAPDSWSKGGRRKQTGGK